MMMGRNTSRRGGREPMSHRPARSNGSRSGAGDHAGLELHLGWRLESLLGSPPGHAARRTRFRLRRSRRAAGTIAARKRSLPRSFTWNDRAAAARPRRDQGLVRPRPRSLASRREPRRDAIRSWLRPVPVASSPAALRPRYRRRRSTASRTPALSDVERRLDVRIPHRAASRSMSSPSAIRRRRRPPAAGIDARLQRLLHAREGGRSRQPAPLDLVRRRRLPRP